MYFNFPLNVKYTSEIYFARVTDSKNIDSTAGVEELNLSISYISFWGKKYEMHTHIQKSVWSHSILVSADFHWNY